MSTLLGISGASRNACAAVCVDGDIRAVCEQERLVRIRGVGLDDRVPSEAVDEVLALASRRRGDVTRYVLAEERAQLPSDLDFEVLDHHEAHAATAFFTSPFKRAAVLVCDRDRSRDFSVWIGDGTTLIDQKWRLGGEGFALLYSECAEVFGFAPNAQEHRLEALARLGRGQRTEEFRRLLRYEDRSLVVDPGWKVKVEQMVGTARQTGSHALAEVASSFQHRLGEVLVDVIADVCQTLGVDTLCLGGGLFFNTYFNTVVRGSGVVKETFVPINPGNAGLAVGATLLVGAADHALANRAVSPFLGPEYDSEAIKSVLDSCKLSYEFASEGQVLDATVAALTKGHIVAWFQGRMEWGPRALGHRSILADPRSPYVLDNLNCYLKKRERSRGFGVAVSEEEFNDFFCGSSSSAFMEYEYKVRDPGQFRHVIPHGATTIRVQTVKPTLDPFYLLLNRMKHATGCGIVVNTSFNEFREPIVCNPRDAIRAFYGTGLDMLVMGRFILRK
jgi:carbamoyltransferase